MKIILIFIFALLSSVFASEKYGVYDAHGNRILTFEAKSDDLLSKVQQIKNDNPQKNLYISSLSKGNNFKPTSHYRYKAEAGAYIEVSRKETFSVCPDKQMKGIWISEHSVSLNVENCLSVQAPNIAGTFRILFLQNSGNTDTIQVLVDQSYIQMGDYSHKMYVPDKNTIDSIIRLNPRASWYNVLPGNYENKKYNQPLIVDKTKFTMGDAHYYAETGNIPKRKRIYKAEIYPKNIEESKLPYVEYIDWMFANERSKKEGLDTAYTSIDIRNYNIKNSKNLILLGDIGAIDAPHIFLAVDTSASGYRLPFEDEWFFLMRAGASTRYYWGDEEDSFTVSRYAWIHPIGLKPVAQLLPNRFGLYDMAGIAGERVMTYYSTISDGIYRNYYDLALSFDNKYPESYFMREMRTIVQATRTSFNSEKCEFKKNEIGERNWICKTLEQEPKLISEKANYRTFRLIRKTPKLYKLEKF